MSESKLLISYVRPHREVSKDTIARWVRTVMMGAGLDVAIFKPHSTRSAAASKAKRACVPLSDILRHAEWSASKHTFHIDFEIRGWLLSVRPCLGSVMADIADLVVLIALYLRPLSKREVRKSRTLIRGGS